jgi:uncharacterized membrane protein
MNNQQIKTLARKVLNQNLLPATSIFAGYIVINLIINYMIDDQSLINIYLVLLISGSVFSFLLSHFTILSYNQSQQSITSYLNSNITFQAITKNIASMVVTYLWTLLLIIPGLIKAYSYALVPFIAIEQPQLSTRETLRLSEKMMRGKKMDLLNLSISFFWWLLLVVITYGVAGVYVLPYLYYATYIFYQQCKVNEQLDINT